MPNKNYQRGRRFEWQVKKDMESNKGWTVLRTAGSHGFADLIGVSHDSSVCFVQCKVAKDLKAATATLKKCRKEWPLKIADNNYYVCGLLALKIHGHSKFEYYLLTGV